MSSTKNSVSLYLSIQRLEGQITANLLEEIRAGLSMSQQNQAYLDAILRSAAKEQVLLQRLSALGCLIRIVKATLPHLLPHMTLHREENGRPYATLLRHDAPPIDFSLTHSDAHAACALLIGGGRVGLDIEELIEQERAQKISRRFFSEGEQAYLAEAESVGDVSSCATRIWTAKEAIAKQNGSSSYTACDSSCPSEGIRLFQGYLESTGAALTLCVPKSCPPPLLCSPSPLITRI